MYQPLRASRSERLPIRTLEYHVRLWEGGGSAPAAPPLVMVHGWMDVGASYQFVVDAFGEAFAAERRIIAPDWRGFGHSMPPARCDHYPFADYLADLDRLLDHYAPGQPVDLVGHSMGGNVAMAYAGVRPQRIRRLVNLEGFGLPATEPAQAPARYAQWLDELRGLDAGDRHLKAYASAEAVAARLMKTNPRLGRGQAEWLAREWAQPDDRGAWHILGDAAHKVVNPLLYRVEEALALYAAIAAPVLAVEASNDSMGLWWKGRYDLDQYHERLRHVPDCRVARVQDAGHMLHHDQPAAVARLIEEFLQAP
ncbi:alpha/beta hydrolase [Acidovorax sp. GBBC 3334]|uniref:alpha/beta fold hydrolase n=1 Tax=Acidovorax sp. GBBC 3334 TaxID=2940496 RepID=UPI00230498CC|nr:alpha/beta hydrolase [Acidovorax sp. GBBC 3334]MDA8456354.1 alpha/beta hydrolase [Acidovorax sp. GBBC 3334]